MYVESDIIDSISTENVSLCNEPSNSRIVSLSFVSSLIYLMLSSDKIISGLIECNGLIVPTPFVAVVVVSIVSK